MWARRQYDKWVEEASKTSEKVSADQKKAGEEDIKNDPEQKKQEDGSKDTKRLSDEEVNQLIHYQLP